jgi:hypothetical protein
MKLRKKYRCHYDLHILSETVSKMTGYRLDDHALFLIRNEEFFFCHRCVQTSSKTHSVFYPIGAEGSFLGKKLMKREADHSTRQCAKDYNIWSFTCPPFIHLESELLRYWYNFTFLFCKEK